MIASQKLTCERMMVRNVTKDPIDVVTDLCVNTRTVPFSASVAPAGDAVLDVGTIFLAHKRPTTVTLQTQADCENVGDLRTEQNAHVILKRLNLL